MNPDLYRIEDAIQRIDALNLKCEDNMKRLNSMMLELKGLIGMVRAKSNRPGMEWYNTEIQDPKSEIRSAAFEIEDLTIKEIELKK